MTTLLLVAMLTGGCWSMESPGVGQDVSPTPSSSPLATDAVSPTPTPPLTSAPTATATAGGTLGPVPSLGPTPTSSPTPDATPGVNFELTSDAFAAGEPIPSEFTCDGADNQLPVSWSGVPDGTAELALLMDDPDAGGFVHWLVLGMDPDATEVPAEANQAPNDFGRSRYSGPCPPSGNHNYRLTLFALSAPLDLGPQPTRRQFRQAADAAAIATAELRGTYQRTR